MHLDEEQVQRLLDGEISGPPEAAARRHLEGCGDCRARLDGAAREEGEVQALLRHLDGPPLLVDADAIAARARGHELWWMRRAAGFLLALGLAGAAYALPGSPLRPWVRAAATWVGIRLEAPRPAQPRTHDAETRLAGIAVVPGATLLIEFSSSQTEGGARVSLTDGAELVVQAPVGAATFTSDATRLVIDNRGSSATFDVQIPRTAPRVEIRVRERRVFLKEGPRISADGSVGAPGPFLIPLGHSEP